MEKIGYFFLMFLETSLALKNLVRLQKEDEALIMAKIVIIHHFAWIETWIHNIIWIQLIIIK